MQRRATITPPIAAILAQALAPSDERGDLPIVDVAAYLRAPADPVGRISAAFLACAAGPNHPSYARAVTVLHDELVGPAADLAAFYMRALERMEEESVGAGPVVAERLERAASAMASAGDAAATAEAMWSAFFPQGTGITGHADARVEALRARREVTVTELARDPIVAPDREVLFTSNVLLTIPDASTDLDGLPYPETLRTAIRAAAAEPQRYWFDHPIQIGVEPEANELLYGLRGLDRAVADESTTSRVTCLLSVSVTHDGLAPIARQYVEAELARDGGMANLDVVVVTEADTARIIDEALVPALGGSDPSSVASLHRVFGVDGRYGRHYSFLKAVLALWHVAVDSAVRATFKIDLDQVFPQDALRAETGRSMFEHLCTPLWGAKAVASDGRKIELGMIAGALVNERDIDEGLFTPDVRLPDRSPVADEYVFFSAMPQAISTRAEMMERYDGPEIDGLRHALERIHVTGGTNGIRLDTLRRQRPFTPSWVGRAEDQAYLLSVLDSHEPRLAYAHAAGLIMRHDKEAFAGQAMAAAHVAKLIGDDVRILMFSAYVAALGDGGADTAYVRRLLDPFTGCFVSDIPSTLVSLRLALRTLRLLESGATDDAREYAREGVARVTEALETDGDPATVIALLAEERAAWDSYYEAIDAIEAGDSEAGARAAEILADCRVGSA